MAKALLAATLLATGGRPPGVRRPVARSPLFQQTLTMRSIAIPRPRAAAPGPSPLADAVRRVASGLRVVDPTLAAETLATGENPLTPP